MNRYWRHAENRAGSRTSPINHRGANYFFTGAESKQRKKKNQKERTKEGDACGNCRSRGNRVRWPSAPFFLMISSAAWKTLLGLPQLPQARLRRLTLKPLTKGGSLLLDRGGLFLRCQKHFLLEILFASRFFKFPADFLDFQRKIWIFRWKIYSPGDFLIFRLNFEISGGIFRVPLEIWIFRRKFYLPADFSNFPQIFWISSGRFGFPAGKFIFQEIF